MRLPLVVCISLLSGALAGVGLTWARYGHSPHQLIPEANRAVPRLQESPRLVAEEEGHDFGVVGQGTTVRHAFVVKNDGRGVLRLKAGQTTCAACTIAELAMEEVPPGASTEVVVEYKATGRTPFRQTATVLSNDPLRSRLELTVTGKVAAQYDIVPPEINFGNVPVGATVTEEAQVLRFVEGELQVTDPQIVEGGSGEWFDLRVEPLAASELKHDALGGYRLLATLKPGLPLGPFLRTIRVTLEFGKEGERAERQILVAGKIVSDLSIVGAGWHGEASVLALGSVPREAGARRELTLLVRGKHRDSIVVEPLTSDPDWLKVTVGERKKLNDAVDQIPLTVEIPAGRGPSIHLGTDQGALGQIVLGVKNYPDLTEIRIRVKFVIE